MSLHLSQTAQSKSQFGVGLECLVPPDSTQVPAVLEKCLQYIEEHGQCSMMMIASISYSTRSGDLYNGQNANLVCCLLNY